MVQMIKKVSPTFESALISCLLVFIVKFKFGLVQSLVHCQLADMDVFVSKVQITME